MVSDPVNYMLPPITCPRHGRQFAGDLRGVISVAMHPGWVQTDLGNSVGPAPLSPAASARGMASVIDSLSASQTGQFIDYQGRKIQW